MDADLTQTEVADRAKMYPATITYFLSGRTPKTDEVEALAAVFGANPAWLAFGTGLKYFASELNEAPPPYIAKLKEEKKEAIDLVRQGLDSLEKVLEKEQTPPATQRSLRPKEKKS